MANTKITELTQLTNPVSTDVLPIVDVAADVTKKISIADLLKNASAGTAAAPGIAFDGDTNTGIYSPGADQVAISTNGTGRLFVDSNGRITNVGTGLQVNYGGYSDVTFVDPGSGNNIYLLTYAPGNAFFLGSNNGATFNYGWGSSSISHVWHTGSSNERMRLDSSGHLGLGTSSPSDQLHLSGGALRVSNALGYGATFANTSSTGMYITLADTGSSAGVGCDNGALTFRANGNTTERARITSDGKLGLGTSSPSVLLQSQQVSAGSSVIGCSVVNNSATTGTGVIFDLTPSTAAPGARGAQIEAVNTNGLNEISLSLKTSSGGNPPATRLHIAPAGKVGINTTSPQNLLDLRQDSPAFRQAIVAESGGYSTQFGVAYSTTNTFYIDANATGQPTVRIFNWGAYGNLTLNYNSVSSSRAFIVTDGATERARIDSSGRLLVGTSSARGNFYNSTISSAFQIEGTTTNTQTASIISSSSTTSSAPTLLLGKQLSNAVGGNTVVTSGTITGRISFQGSDGTQFVETANIESEVDGTPGADDMPGRLVFSTTADGASSPTERMRITSNGTVSVGSTASSSNAKLLVNGGIAELDDRVLTINKSINGSATAQTVLTLTVPATTAAYLIEATYVSSRAGSGTSVGQSRVAKESYFISRNGSGSDVVLTSNLNSADYEVLTTTAGGSFTPDAISAAIARGGAEANTDPQSVVITATVGDVGNANGYLLARFTILQLGTKATVV